MQINPISIILNVLFRVFWIAMILWFFFTANGIAFYIACIVGFAYLTNVIYNSYVSSMKEEYYINIIKNLQTKLNNINSAIKNAKEE